MYSFRHFCFKGLAEVFDPRRKPWIEMGEEATTVIVNQMHKCPSGAISIVSNSGMQ